MKKNKMLRVLPLFSKKHVFVVGLIVALILQMGVLAFQANALVPNSALSITSEGFHVSGSVTVDGLDQSGPGSFENGSIKHYPEGSCVPILVTASHTHDVADDVLISPNFDYFNDVIGVEDLEAVTMSNPGDNPNDADNLDDFTYTGTSLGGVTSFETASGGTAVTAEVSGPFVGDGDGEDDNIGPTDEMRHYNILLKDVDPEEEVYVLFCARLGVDAADYSGASMHVRTAQGGAKNIAINTNQIDSLPSLTLTKEVTGTADPDEFSFTVFPAIDGLSEFDIPDGESSVVIENVPDGEYSVVETGPSAYTFTEGSGTNCTFEEDGETGTATVESGDPATDAECIFHNSVTESTITVTKEVNNDNGGTLTYEDFTLYVDETEVTSGEPNAFVAGDYVISEDTVDGYTGTFGGACDESGNLTLEEGQHAECTITNDDEPASLTITKVVDGGDASASDFTITVTDSDETDDAEFAGDADGTEVTLDADSYTVTETSVTGYTGTFSGDCATDGIIILEPGEDASCTLTNTYSEPAPTQGTLTVTKTVVNDNGGTASVEDFTLLADSTTLTSGTATSLDPGTHTVTESGPSGYEGTFGGDCASDGTVTVVAGEDAECTLENDDKPATLTVIKTVVNDDDGTDSAEDFTIILDIDGSETTFAGDADGTDTELDAGASYTVSEEDAEGYNATLSGDCSGTASLGEELTCTVTNDDESTGGGGGGGGDGGGGSATGTITVTKVVVNDDGGDMEVADVTLLVDSTEVSSGVSTSFSPGSYTVSETGDDLGNYTATFTGDCDADGDMTLGANQSLTCTITNDDNEGAFPSTGAVTLEIEIVNDDEGSATEDDFDLFINEDPVDEGDESDLAPGTHTVTFENNSGQVYAATFSGACDTGGDIVLEEDDDVVCTVTFDDEDSGGSTGSEGRSGGGGGGNQGGNQAVGGDTSEPEPEPTIEAPEPEVLGVTDEKEPEEDVVEEPTPEPQVLGEVDELPVTGMPAYVLLTLLMMTTLLVWTHGKYNAKS